MPSLCGVHIPCISPTPTPEPSPTDAAPQQDRIAAQSVAPELPSPNIGRSAQARLVREFEQGSSRNTSRASNPFKDERLGYFVHDKEMMQRGVDTIVYRKQPDSKLFGKANRHGEQSITLAAHPKHALYRTSSEFEFITIKDEPTPGMRSYQLSLNEPMKVVSWGDEAAGGGRYPLATGTSRPGLVCVTDGMAVCTAVVVGGTSPDKRSAHIKVFHIQPDINVDAVEAIAHYMDQLRSQGLTNFKVAMHGGNFYTPDETLQLEREQKTTAQLRQLFDQDDVSVEIDEVSEKRGNKRTCLGAVIRKNGDECSIRIINELVAPEI